MSTEESLTGTDTADVITFALQASKLRALSHEMGAVREAAEAIGAAAQLGGECCKSMTSLLHNTSAVTSHHHNGHVTNGGSAASSTCSGGDDEEEAASSSSSAASGGKMADLHHFHAVRPDDFFSFFYSVKHAAGER